MIQGQALSRPSRRSDPPRTLLQNALYHVAYVERLAEHLRQHGQPGITHDEAHEEIKRELLSEDRFDVDTGEVIERVGSTATMTVREFNAFLERVAKWLLEKYGIVV